MHLTPALRLIDVAAHLEPAWDGLPVGTYSCAISKNGRLSLPSAFKDTFHANGFDDIGAYACGDHIAVLPARRMDASIRRQHLIGMVEHDLFATIVLFKLGESGTITLPTSFIEAAGLTSTVLLVGLGRRVEIWNPEAYSERQNDRAPPRHQTISCGRSAELIS